ncbi:MAG: hypothetical protein JKY81_06630 [Colwellia sp.]|nr:hypothetical protein [Colwellia sp.]
MTKQNGQKVIVARFELSDQGLCRFDENQHYQLQASSRLSFLGCWLILQPLSAVGSMFNEKNNKPNTQYFIYRDSLSEQDFSHLSKVIAQLNRQH